MTQQWKFSAVDTLFFRESRPMESIGGSQLGSVFPPPPRTLIGAIRTAIGEHRNTDWHDYTYNPENPTRKVMGAPDELAPLSFRGPFVFSQQERLFPVPLAYLQASSVEGKAPDQTRLVPSKDPVECDLGKVRLPVKEKADLAGAKPLEGAFVTQKGLMAFLEKKPIHADQIRKLDELIVREPRLGIGRDNKTNVVETGLLYQTCHLRPLAAAGLEIAMTVSGLKDVELPARGAVRLCAEGRIATWELSSTDLKLPPLSKAKGSKGLMLVLLTPALFENGWLPDGFEAQTDEQGSLTWVGTVNGVVLRLISAVVGKPTREGGWDMAKHRPREVISCAPAGSCYFCEVVQGGLALDVAQKRLQNQQIGQQQELGRGELAVGYW